MMKIVNRTLFRRSGMRNRFHRREGPDMGEPPRVGSLP